MKTEVIIPTILDELAFKWESAKLREQAANAERLGIEEQILAVEKAELKEEGSVTVKSKWFKVTLTTKLDRKLDEEVWSSIHDSIPENLRPVKNKLVIDLPLLRALQVANAEFFKLASKAITVKPAKTGVKVERVEETQHV